MSSKTRSLRTSPESSSFLRLPLEIRQQIYSYLLPKTVRLILPRRNHGKEVAWRRGNTAILTLNRQIHIETASMLYGGSNIFVLEVDYDGIRFQFQRLMSSGLIPKQTPRFLDKITKPNLRFFKNVIINVNHVDSYTGMIKYNCGGRGLTNGIKLQAKKLVDVLKTAAELSTVHIHFVDHKCDVQGSEQALEPFAELDNVRDKIVVTGVADPNFLEKLRHARQIPNDEEHVGHRNSPAPSGLKVMPDLALANFYEEIHATPKELQGF